MKQVLRRGFTLIELLVVIAIIGVLAALLLPVLSRAKARAQGVTCISNFKQLNLAWQMYATDHGGVVVFGAQPQPNNRFTPTQRPWVCGTLGLAPNNWDNIRVDLLISREYAAFAPYIQNPKLYKCPSDRSTAVVAGTQRNRVRSYQTAGGWLYHSQLQNSRSASDPRFIPKVSFIVSPADELTFIEGHADTIRIGRFPSPTRLPHEKDVDYPSLAFLQDLPGSRHNGSSVVAFGDGRVETKKWRDSRTTPPEAGVERRPEGSFYLISVSDPANEDALWIDRHTQNIGRRDGRRP